MNPQNNLVYCGSFSTTQTNGNKTLLNYGAPTYSKKQNELYSRLLVGKNAYTNEQWYALNQTKKRRILKVHKKAQQIFNIWKQEIMLKTIFITKENKTVSYGLLKIFNAINDVEPDPNFKCKLHWSELGIKKENIIEKLMQERLLPANFYSL
jgi:hypothetical protein